MERGRDYPLYTYIAPLYQGECGVGYNQRKTFCLEIQKAVEKKDNYVLLEWKEKPDWKFVGCLFLLWDIYGPHD